MSSDAKKADEPEASLRRQKVQRRPPRGHQGKRRVPWFIYAIPLAFIALIAGAALWKYLEVRQASDWPSVIGKVVVSTSEVRKVKTFDDNAASGRGEEERNFAKIIYEYTVDGEKLRGTRVSIGEDRGNFEVAETIAKYPVGTVVTVYFDPRHPEQAVLERDAPQGVFGCVIWMVVIGLGLTFGGFYGFEKLGEFIDKVSIKPDNAKATIAFGAFGTAVALFAIAIHRMAAKQRAWPTVEGRIVQSEVDAFRGRTDSGKPQTMYRSRISYAYRYNNIDYRGNNQTSGSQVTSNMQSFAKRAVARFPVGKKVKVYVNPDNPSEATLNPSAWYVWLLWIVAFAVWGVAYYASQR